MTDLQKKYTRASLRVCFRSFPLRFKDIPTERALEVLIELGHGNECVWWLNPTHPGKKYEWTVTRFNESKAVREACPLARNLTNLEFFGGPPGSEKIYAGTLLALLMDRLLCAMDNVGFKALDAVIPLGESYALNGRGWQ